MSIILRETKGAPLTHSEMDKNLLYLSFKSDLLAYLGNIITYDNGLEELKISDLASLFVEASMHTPLAFNAQSELFSGVTVVPFLSIADSGSINFTTDNFNYDISAYGLSQGSLYALEVTTDLSENTVSVQCYSNTFVFVVFLPTDMTNSDFSLFVY